MNLSELAKRIEGAMGNAERLRKAGARGGDETLAELGSAIEELRVTEAELLRQAQELQESQTALEVAHARYLDLFQFAPDPYFTTNRSGIVLEANVAAAHLLGVNAQMLIGMPFSTMLPLEERPRFREALRRLGDEDARTHHWELTILRPGGSPVPVEITVARASDSAGHEPSLRWLVRDISDRRAIEARLALANSVLEDRVRERTERLAKSNSDLVEFAMIAGHDLAEPLRGIRQIVGFLMEDAPSLGPEAADRLARIDRLAGTAADLVRALLAYARLGVAEPDRVPVPLEGVVNRVLESLTGQAAHAHVQVRRPLPVVLGDRVLLGQVFANTIANALKYNRAPQKRIELGARPSGEPGTTLLYVKDNGIGFTKEAAASAFRLFKRLHTSEEFGRGSGVGLVIVKRIVEFHGGRIWVESVPGEGSTVYFTLPTLGTAPDPAAGAVL